MSLGPELDEATRHRVMDAVVEAVKKIKRVDDFPEAFEASVQSVLGPCMVRVESKTPVVIMVIVLDDSDRWMKIHF